MIVSEEDVVYDVDTKLLDWEIPSCHKYQLTNIWFDSYMQNIPSWKRPKKTPATSYKTSMQYERNGWCQNKLWKERKEKRVGLTETQKIKKRSDIGWYFCI